MKNIRTYQDWLKENWNPPLGPETQYDYVSGSNFSAAKVFTINYRWNDYGKSMQGKKNIFTVPYSGRLKVNQLVEVVSAKTSKIYTGKFVSGKTNQDGDYLEIKLRVQGQTKKIYPKKITVLK